MHPNSPWWEPIFMDLTLFSRFCFLVLGSKQRQQQQDSVSNTSHNLQNQALDFVQGHEFHAQNYTSRGTLKASWEQICEQQARHSSLRTEASTGTAQQEQGANTSAQFCGEKFKNSLRHRWLWLLSDWSVWWAAQIGILEDYSVGPWNSKQARNCSGS